MSLSNAVRAIDTLGHHNLQVDDLSNFQWDRFVDTSSTQTLEAVGQALSVLATHRRNKRLERMALEAKSVAAAMARHRTR